MQRKISFVGLAVVALQLVASPVSTAADWGRPTAAPAQSLLPSCWRFAEPIPAATSDAGMVVTAEEVATQVGTEILDVGGNAVDATVAVCFTLAVTLPKAGNIGGGGFLVLRSPEGHTTALDFREKAPLAATRDMYLDADGNVIYRSLYGSLAAGVPGTVMGMAMLHERYGSLPWTDLLAPAIRLAENGFVVGTAHHEDFDLLRCIIASFGPDWRQTFAETERTFLRNGTPPALGTSFRQADLAATLRRIADTGPDGFYKGETADRIVEEMTQSGGIITHRDLATYQAVWRDPIRFDYRGYSIQTMPPPSSGGVTLGAIAQILAGYDLGSYPWDGPERVHLLAEAMRRAYADRNSYLGDPDFVSMPLERMISRAYGDERSATIRFDAATPSSSISPGLGPIPEGENTTHFSIVDADGGAVAVTTTINTRFGSLVTVRGAGFLLNNEMDDFTAKPGVPNNYGLVQGVANAIKPGKRMLSSMTPTIVVDPDGRLFMLTGSPGGSKIISTVFQTISNAIDFSMDLSANVRAPRVHHQHLPDRITFEYGGLPYEAFTGLDRRGHSLSVVDEIGEVQAIMRLPNGRWAGMPDPRGNGIAAGSTR